MRYEPPAPGPAGSLWVLCCSDLEGQKSLLFQPGAQTWNSCPLSTGMGPDPASSMAEKSFLRARLPGSEFAWYQALHLGTIGADPSDSLWRTQNTLHSFLSLSFPIYRSQARPSKKKRSLNSLLGRHYHCGKHCFSCDRYHLSKYKYEIQEHQFHENKFVFVSLFASTRVE